MPATNGNDVLATTSDGEILHGLGRNGLAEQPLQLHDALRDAGSDTLRTDLYFAYDPVDCAITQYGGTGNDLLIATLAASGGRADILLDGGTEDDEIDIYVVGSDFAFAPTDFYTMANGGTGRDRITFQADLGHGYGGIVHNVADGGAGDDYIYANSFLPGSNTLNGGTGNDSRHRELRQLLLSVRRGQHPVRRCRGRCTLRGHPGRIGHRPVLQLLADAVERA